MNNFEIQSICNFETEKSKQLFMTKGLPFYREFYPNSNGNIPPYFARYRSFVTFRLVDYILLNMGLDSEFKFVIWVSGNPSFTKEKAIERNNVLINSAVWQQKFNMDSIILRQKCIEIGGIL